jgi:hypothetical protein
MRIYGQGMQNAAQKSNLDQFESCKLFGMCQQASLCVASTKFRIMPLEKPSLCTYHRKLMSFT